MMVTEKINLKNVNKDESCHHPSVSLSLKKGRIYQNNICSNWNQLSNYHFFGRDGVIYFCNDLAQQTS